MARPDRHRGASTRRQSSQRPSPRGHASAPTSPSGIGRTRDQRPLRRHRQRPGGHGSRSCRASPSPTPTPPTSHSAWLAILRPYLEPQLSNALPHTDLEKIPDGHYAGYQPLKLGDDAITIRVTYQEGWALVLYLASTGNNTWLVASLDEAVEFD